MAYLIKSEDEGIGSLFGGSQRAGYRSLRSICWLSWLAVLPELVPLIHVQAQVALVDVHCG